MTNHPGFAERLPALLDSLEETRDRLHSSISALLNIDPRENADLFEATHHQAMRRIADYDKSLQGLMDSLAPWAENRKRLPSELSGRVDAVLDHLEKEMQDLDRALQSKTVRLNEEKAALQTSLQALNRQRQGVMGYRQKPESFFKGDA